MKVYKNLGKKIEFFVRKKKNKKKCDTITILPVCNNFVIFLSKS